MYSKAGGWQLAKPLYYLEMGKTRETEKYGFALGMVALWYFVKKIVTLPAATAPQIISRPPVWPSKASPVG